MDWREDFEPRPGGLARLRIELDRSTREERLERFWVGGLTIAMAVAVVFVLNVDLTRTQKLREFASTAGELVDLPRTDSNIRILWIMN